jgi:hypothetical protein
MHRKVLSDNLKVGDRWEDEFVGKVLRGTLKMECMCECGLFSLVFGCGSVVGL